MKKLLALIGAFSLMSGGVITAVSCAKKDAPSEIKIRDINDIKNVRSQLNKYHKDKPLIIKDKKPYQDVSAEDVKLTLLKSFTSEVQGKLKFSDEDFQAIKSLGSSWKDSIGKLSFKVSYGDTKIAVDDNVDTFDIYFTTMAIESTFSLKEKLEQNFPINKNMNISDAKLPIAWLPTNIKEFFSNLFAGDTISISFLLHLLPNLIQNLPVMPTKIPTVLNDNDENFKIWNDFKNIILKEDKDNKAVTSLVKTILLKETERNIPVKEGTDKQIKGIKLKYKLFDILDGILPDIIHLINFVKQQHAESKHNLTLLIFQYLMQPANQSYNDDGFDKINKGESGIKTNLDSIIHNLFAGWVTQEKKERFGHPGEVVADTGQGPLKVIVTTVKKGDDKATIDHSVEWNHIHYNAIGNQFNKAVNDLLTKGLDGSLKLDINLRDKFGGSSTITVPLWEKKLEVKDMFASWLPSLLDSTYQESIANNTISLEKGQFVVYYTQTKAGEEANWKKAISNNDILTATDVYIQLQNMQFKLTSTIDPQVSVTTGNKLSLRINLDISTKLFIKDPEEVKTF